MNITWAGLILSAGLLALPSRLGAELDGPFVALDHQLKLFIAEGALVGAQVAAQQAGTSVFSEAYGVVAEDSARKVDAHTLFLIGSSSKPFASACLLSLFSDPTADLSLSDPIDRWLPAFAPATAKIEGGGSANRSPTIEELLSHHSGIFSQKEGMTPAQGRWIRNFDITLEEAVKGISFSPLIRQPGAQYAYSGAGYCVLGRVAELATQQSFEDILQQRLCVPLNLTRTTFFPFDRFPDDEIATGAGRSAAPHLLEENHRFPLIGGSLYTTAEEMTAFGQAIGDGIAGRQTPLEITPKLFQELTQPRSRQSGYSLGWSVLVQRGQAVRLSHSGSLQSYRSWIAVNPVKRISIAGCWTLSKTNDQPDLATLLQRVLRDL